MLSIRNSFRFMTHTGQKSRDEKKFHANVIKKRAGWQYLYHTKQTLSQKLTKLEGHYLIKGLIYPEDIIITNI